MVGFSIVRDGKGIPKVLNYATHTIFMACNSETSVLCVLTIFFPLSKEGSSKVGFKCQMKAGVEVWEVVGVTWCIFNGACRASAWLVVLHIAFGRGDCSFGKLILSRCIGGPTMAKGFDLGRVETSCVCYAIIYVTNLARANTKLVVKASWSKGHALLVMAIRASEEGLASKPWNFLRAMPNLMVHWATSSTLIGKATIF